MAGSVFKRCGCRDERGKLLGAACPRLRTRSHGSWSFKVEVAAAGGGRRRAGQGGFSTRRDAEVALTDMLDRVNKRTHVDVGRQSVGWYLEQWIAGKAALRSTTARSYREHLDLYLLPALGQVRLSELDEQDIEGMYEAMRQLGHPPSAKTGVSVQLEAMLSALASGAAPRPLSAARLQRVHATLRAALNSAVKRRLIAHNPALHVELSRGARPRAVIWTDERTRQWRAWRDAEVALEQALCDAERRRRSNLRHRGEVEPSVSEVRRREEELADHRRNFRTPAVAVWTPAQTGRFLDAIAGHRLYALYHLIAFRGLRRGEAVGLTWVHVDLDGADLTVAAQIVQLGYATEQATPKADSQGVVALDSGTVRVLREHRERQRRDAASWGPAWTDTGLVFTREDGTALHPELVSRTFERLVRDAGLPPIRLHDLRHGAATLALAGGADMKVVSHMLRHSSITITADTYTSVLPETARHAAEAAVAIVPRAAAASRPEPSSPDVPVPHRSHTVPETTLGPSSEEKKPRSGAVRRQGLEPRTRGLRE